MRNYPDWENMWSMSVGDYLITLIEVGRPTHNWWFYSLRRGYRLEQEWRKQAKHLCEYISFSLLFALDYGCNVPSYQCLHAALFQIIRP